MISLKTVGWGARFIVHAGQSRIPFPLIIDKSSPGRQCEVSLTTGRGLGLGKNGSRFLAMTIDRAV